MNVMGKIQLLRDEPLGFTSLDLQNTNTHSISETTMLKNKKKLEKSRAVDVSVRLSRKDMRKEKRKRKKQVKEENLRLHQNQKASKANVASGDSERPGKFVLLKHDKHPSKTKKQDVSKNQPCLRSQVDELNADIQADKSKQKSMEKAMKKQRARHLADANKKEDKTIKLLEKQLNLDKRKSKALSKSFVDSGLDSTLLFNMSIGDRGKVFGWETSRDSQTDEYYLFTETGLKDTGTNTVRRGKLLPAKGFFDKEAQTDFLGMRYSGFVLVMCVIMGLSLWYVYVSYNIHYSNNYVPLPPSKTKDGSILGWLFW